MSLNNSLYQAIMRHYDQIQAEDRRDQQIRIREIYDKIPEYGRIESDIVAACASAARQRALGTAGNVSSDSQALISSLREHTETLQSRQKELLREYGFPEDYADMRYQCPLCQDTGWHDGQKCRCFQAAVSAELAIHSNLGILLEEENFSTFNLDYYPVEKDKKLGISPRRNMEDILDRCREFIRHFDDQPSNLFIYGKTGVGKTFLTHCIAKELLDQSKTVLYLTSFELIEIFETHTFGSPETSEDLSENALFDALMDCDALIIDDLGTEMTNTFTISQLFLCINERQLRKKSTIISTNLSLEEIQDIYSERIFARIISYYDILLLVGDDIRIRKALS